MIKSEQTLAFSFGKIIMYGFLGLMVCSIVLMAISLNKINQLSTNIVEQELRAIATTLSGILDGDYIESIQMGDEDTPEYQKTLSTLRKIKKDNDIAYLYILRKATSGTTFILDTDEEAFAAIGDEYITTYEMETAFNGTITVTEDYLIDEYGKFKTGYAPVYNSNGSVVAVVCADYDSVLIDEDIRNYTVFFIIVDIAVLLSITALVVIGSILSYTKIRNQVFSSSEELQKLSDALIDIADKAINNSSMLVESGNSSAAAVNEISAAIGETSAMIRRTDENTQSASEYFRDAYEQLTESIHRMEILESSIDVIQSSSHEINQVINSITEIASQTKILAINAEIESARVGEAGQGFKVVARAVGDLAQSSDDSVKISANIIEKNIKNAKIAANDSQAVSAAIKSVTQKVNQLTTIINEISTTSAEQTKGSVYISQAIPQIESTIVQSAGLADETKASAEILGNIAKDIDIQIVSLKKLVKKSDI